MRDSYHPEKLPGEVFLSNVDTEAYLNSFDRFRSYEEMYGGYRSRGIDGTGWASRRAGLQAFSIFGEPLKDSEPVFVQRSEMEADGIEIKPSAEEVLAEFDEETIAEAARRLFEDEDFKPAIAHLFCDTYMDAIERLMAEGNYIQLAKAAMKSSGGGRVFDSDDRVLTAWYEAAEQIAARPRMGR